MFKELPGAKGPDDSVLPLTGPTTPEASGLANGAAPPPNGRFYGELPLGVSLKPKEVFV